MSFRQNGNFRGHTPPVQYRTAQDPGQALRERKSFDNGDDAPFFDNSANMHRGDSSHRTAGTAQAELGIDSLQNNYQSPRGSYASAAPGYQYQSSSGSPQLPHTLQSPTSYNPQQFARTMSQSQPQPAAYHSNAQAYSGTGGPSNIAPYNPALYQQHQPAQSPQIPPYAYNPSYASPTVPQSSNYWPAHSYSQSQAGPSVPPASLPPKPAAYLPQSQVPPPLAAPYSYNGPPYPEDRTSSPYGRTSQSIRIPISSELPRRPVPYPPTSQVQRHPTLRPLPSAPEDEGPVEDWDEAETVRSSEELDQERLFDDISNNLQQHGSRRSAVHQYHDLLDGELEERRRYDSEATTLHSVSNLQGSAYDEEESDPEAAAGLEAMRIADQQDLDGGALFDSYMDTPPSTVEPRYQEVSSDSDYAQGAMDMGFYSGGYPGQLSYGDEMEDQSRPLPMPHDIHRPEGHHPPPGLGGIVSYQEVSGSSQQASRQRAYSYDNGDEGSSIPSGGADSRLSGRSGSSSPIKDDYDDFFYHGPGPNGSGDRPLPALPLDSEPARDNRTSVSRPSGDHRGPRDNQYEWHSEALQSYYTPNGYEQLLSPTAQVPPVIRSQSTTNSSNYPRASAPIRAKTDAEQRQEAKNRLSKQMQISRAGGSLDGYDSGSAPIPPDLPTLPPGGRRKKFNPEKLSSIDFKRCSEPWALSSVAGWLREMCGGETESVDSDLKANMLSEGLVNLFTHKVPTMNTTDAETLSDHVIKSMFDAGLLIRDEEWVKLGAGEISGILWQLTGSGCYSPRVHNQEIPGRCYSKHCSRTLKRISLLHSEASRKKEDWDTFFKMTPEQKMGKSNKEIERQHVLHEVVTSEDTFRDDLHVLSVVYRDGLLSSQPPVVNPDKLEKLVEEVYGRVEAIKKVNEENLLPQLKYKQQMEGPWISGYAGIFREWIRKSQRAYINYAAGLPHAMYRVRRESDRNMLFAQFLKSAQNNKLSNRLPWDSFLKAPIVRLQRYTLLLGTVLKLMREDSEEKSTLEKAIQEIKKVTQECNDKVAEMEKVVELKELNAKLILRPGLGPKDLFLKNDERQLLFRGDLIRAGHNRFTWLDAHVILYDHYLVISKVVPSKDPNDNKRGERYDVSKAPIPMQLLILESANDDVVVKKDVIKGLGAITTSARATTPSGADAKSRNANGDRPYPLNHTATNSSVDSGSTLGPKSNLTTNLESDEKRMYPFRIKHLGKTDVYTLYASTAKSREEWCDHIVTAKTRHAAALHEQNAEPFGLKVLADSAFAFDDATAASKKDSGVAIKETPLYRAIRENDERHGPMRPAPVCRAQVNCATGFTAFGKAMLAIGTDYGVFTTEVGSTRGWNRVIMASNVTQIAVLEEFSIFLVLASKSLVAHHLDLVVPPSEFHPPPTESARRAPQRLSGSNVSFFVTCRLKERTLVIFKKKENVTSVFKMMEPIFQKSTEKKGNFFGRKMLRGGTTDFFRDFDEFYVPAESFGLNVFKTNLAVLTTKGFELLTSLDSKICLTVPNPDQDKSYGALAPRLAGQKPLGMFRLHDGDFMLVYEDCGVYIDKYGFISRSVILELIGKAKSATMFEEYLILFNEDFVEVRDSRSGRLRQIIAGKDIKCLDAGVEGKGEGGHRSVKIAMSHPEHTSIQLVLELVLNDDSKEWKGTSYNFASEAPWWYGDRYQIPHFIVEPRFGEDRYLLAGNSAAVRRSLLAGDSASKRRSSSLRSAKRSPSLKSLSLSRGSSRKLTKPFVFG